MVNGKYEHHTLKKWGIDLEEQGNYLQDAFHSAALLNEKRYKLNMYLTSLEYYSNLLSFLAMKEPLRRKSKAC